MNKVMMVTGARRGLGLAVAKKYAGEGYNVILNDRLEKEKLEAIKNELKISFDIEVLICYGDISNEEDVKRMLEEVDRKFGRLDVLVNNAGIVYDMEIDERPTSIFEETIHNNVTGTYLMCKYFGKFMFSQDFVTRIVNISSTNGINYNISTSIDYDASKAAINSLTRNFAIEYAPKTLVNGVAPHWMNTEMNAQLPKEEIEEEISKIYLKRFADPEEVASLVYYLGSEENTYINNEIITISGGY